MSTLLGSKVDCIVPVPAPRIKRKIKLALECITNDISCNVNTNIVVAPARTKRKCEIVAEKNYLIRNENMQITCETQVANCKGCEATDTAINIKCVTTVDRECNEIKSVSPVENDKGPKIVKLIEKCSKERNESNNIVNSNYKADINHVPKLKKNNFNKELTVEFGKCQRDSEEDSGVYFSDSTKVSPNKSDTDILPNTNKENDCGTYVCVDDAFCNTQPPTNHNTNNYNNNYIITSDSVDNKIETNLGPLKILDSSDIIPLVSVLDSFEAETLNMFKESALNECKNSLTQHFDTPFVGESLNLYLKNILNVTNIEELKNDTMDVVDLELECNDCEDATGTRSKVFQETGVDGGCENIFNSVGSISPCNLDTSDVDFFSTNLCFLFNDSCSSDVVNNSVIVKNSQVNFLGINNDSESSNHDSYASYSDNNSPGDESQVVVDKQSFYNNRFENDICVDIQNTRDTDNVNSFKCIENQLVYCSESDFVENEVFITKCENKVKSLISFFENIVQYTTPHFNVIDNNCDVLIQNVDNSCNMITDKYTQELTDVKQKKEQYAAVKKCVSFSDDVTIIEENSMSPEIQIITPGENLTFTNEENNDQFSSISSDEALVERCREFTYETLTVGDDNSSELYSSISPQEIIEETLFPYIEPPNEFKTNESFNNSLDSAENNSLTDLWSNKFSDANSLSDGQVLKNYYSFIDVNCNNSGKVSRNFSNSSYNNELNSFLNEFSEKSTCEYGTVCNLEVESDDLCTLKNETHSGKLSSNITINEIVETSVTIESQYNNRGLYEVILHKTWGTVGIKLEKDKDTNELLIADLQPGGAAESTGLITKGVVRYSRKEQGLLNDLFAKTILPPQFHRFKIICFYNLFHFSAMLFMLMKLCFAPMTKKQQKISFVR